MRVCFFGAYDPAYPRNRILRAGLERAGIEVTEARAAEHRVVRRYPALAVAFARAARGTDALIVPEFRHKDVPLARALKAGRLLVFDPLVSRHDTLVMDWGIHAERSAQAWWNARIDRLALRLADLVLCDTWAHGALFERLGARPERLRRVLVGAEDAFFAVPAPPPKGPVRLLYVGGFLPLHGVLTLLEAAARLEERAAGLPDYAIDLVGVGIQHDEARRRALELGLERVVFQGRAGYGEAPRLFAGAHVVLGAFGATEKAGRVIPHKVYQGLAAGRLVVTGDGSGLREVFTPGEHLVAVPRADPACLAEALARAIADPALRERVGAWGRARCLEVGTVERIGRDLALLLRTGVSGS